MPFFLALWLALPYHSRDDLAFIAAQEWSVQAFAPKAVPPEPIRANQVAIADLGDPWWVRRELATKRLARASVFDPRWLIWRDRVKDPEIRWRMRAIAGGVFACWRCQGTG